VAAVVQDALHAPFPPVLEQYKDAADVIEAADVDYI
jgi:hypothetical protein